MPQATKIIRQSAAEGLRGLFCEIQVVQIDTHYSAFKLVKYLLFFLGFLIFGMVAGLYVYQNADSLKHIELGRATTAIKAKGIGFDHNALNSSLGRLRRLGGGYVQKVFDSADYVVPQTENNAIFIISRMLEREGQTIDFCEENASKVKEAICDQKNNTCPNKDSKRNNDWNGVPTGNCITSKYNESQSVCEVLAWCPVERYDDDSNVIYNVRNYTLFIKNHVDFPEFNLIYNNLVQNITDDFLKGCAFDVQQNPHCPVFTIDYILNQMYPNNTIAQNGLLYNGAFVEIKINWYCPYHTDEYCWPTYAFKHVDRDIEAISSGFNTRDADYYEVNNTLYRNIYKVYGLRFIVNVQAKMWRWGFNETATYVGTWSMIIVSIAGIFYGILEFIYLKCKTHRNGETKQLVNK